MTFNEAILKVFDNDTSLELSSSEIWELISKKTSFKSNGKTPQATLNTLMLYNSVNSVTKKVKNPKFVIVNNRPMKFQLINNAIEKENVKEDEIETLEITSEDILEITSKEIDWKSLKIINNNNIVRCDILDCEEYTYIIEDKVHCSVKIGRTKNNPEQRLLQLKTANPSIEILHVCSSKRFSEKQLHDMFNDYRKDLEWFFYTKAIKSFIEKEMLITKKALEIYKTKTDLTTLENSLMAELKSYV